MDTEAGPELDAEDCVQCGFVTGARPAPGGVVLDGELWVVVHLPAGFGLGVMALIPRWHSRNAAATSRSPRAVAGGDGRVRLLRSSDDRHWSTAGSGTGRPLRRPHSSRGDTGSRLGVGRLAARRDLARGRGVAMTVTVA